MTTQTEALTIVASLCADGVLDKKEEAILRKALAQPEQEPEYWLGYGLQAHTEKPFEGATPVWIKPQPKEPEQEPVACNSLCVECTKRGDWACAKAIPPQRTWVGLTDEEWQEIADKYNLIIWSSFKQEIEAKLKEKNT